MYKSAFISPTMRVKSLKFPELSVEFGVLFSPVDPHVLPSGEAVK